MSETKLPPPDFAAPTVYEYTADQMLAYGKACAEAARLEERYIVEMMVASGHISAEKVEQARRIAAGFPVVVVSDSVPADEVHFRNSRGDLVGRITNIAAAIRKAD